MPELFVDCAIPVEVDTLFTYRVPTELHPLIKRGVRVIAPFGRRTVIGIVHTISTFTTVQNLKSIQDVLDTGPVMSEELLGLSDWIAGYYIASRGDVIKTMLVQGATRPGRRTARLTIEDTSALLTELSSAPRQAAIVKALEGKKGVSLQHLQKTTGIKGMHAILSSLERRGVVTVEEEVPGEGLKPKSENVIVVNAAAKERWQEALADFGSRRQTQSMTRQSDILRSLLALSDEAVPLSDFLKTTGFSLSTIRTMEKKAFLKISQREVNRTVEYGESIGAPALNSIAPNRHQQVALDAITSAMRRGAYHAFLLHGITGSGKTQVYIEAIRHALAAGKTAIVLVPEISLTPQIVRRFKEHFGEKVVALHSRMSPGERYDAWRLTHQGKYSIVIGPRSAIFAPLKNLGLIAVDEEHEPSYKQFDQTPRYHARDVALVRGSLAGAVVVLGSATPSMESFANAKSGKYTLLELPERVDNAKLPTVEVVDMAAERRRKLAIHKEGRKADFKEDPVLAKALPRRFVFGSVSDLLKEKIEDRLKKKEGIILLQNRRGYSPFIECPDCGYVEMCDRCSISLTYHLSQRHLRCHYCGFVKEPPDICPKCRSIDIAYRGVGTQRVEEELHELFPDLRLVRMDLDTTSERGSHDAILRKFAAGEADVLLGTQMVAKGLDFSRVTLVGVISADTQMLLPDFRASERTFQLLTQVAGRAGRSALAGEVVIQSFQPGHESLKYVGTHDFVSFFEQELPLRKELEYPPFTRIVLIEFRGEKEDEVMRHATWISERLHAKESHLRILGPAPAVIAKVRNVFRWHIVVKDSKERDPSGKRLHRSIRETMEAYRADRLGKSRSVKVIIDIDPVGMM